MKELVFIYSRRKTEMEPILVVDSKEVAEKIIRNFPDTEAVTTVKIIPYYDGDPKLMPWDVQFRKGHVDSVVTCGLYGYSRVMQERLLNYYAGTGDVCVLANDAEEAIAQAKALIREKFKGADKEE